METTPAQAAIKIGVKSQSKGPHSYAYDAYPEIVDAPDQRSSTFEAPGPEDALRQHPDVVEVTAFGKLDPKWGEAVCAAVVARPGSSLSEAALIEHCQSIIASYKKPKVIEFVDELPKMVNGKIDKQAVRSLILDRRQDSTAFVERR